MIYVMRGRERFISILHALIVRVGEPVGGRRVNLSDLN
jgi:hypothetical protein